MIENEIKELMVFIRKNTRVSKCINVYEQLLYELCDMDYSNCSSIAVRGMHEFISHASRLFKEVDKMVCPEIKSRLLTAEFLMPERYFKGMKFMSSFYYYLNQAYNNIKADKQQKLDIGKRNILGDILDAPEEIKSLVQEEINLISTMSEKEIADRREACRKIVLLWNYSPAIVKAIIQTKRRSFGFDDNSLKFK